MTDNALVYVRSRPFRELLQRIGARHITPPPYTPRWNGKAERFIQTLQNEWAYAHSYPNSTARAKVLSSFCATTTAADHTAHSATGPPSAAFTTSVGSTPRLRRSAGVAQLARASLL